MEEFEQNKIKIIGTYLCYSLAFVSSVISMILLILNNDLNGNTGKIITVFTLSLFSLGIILTGLFFKEKKIRIILAIISIIITIFSVIQIFINVPKKDLVLDFIGKDIKELVSWAEERNIIVEQNFEYSDNIEKYKIIKQDISPGQNAKKIQKIVVTVSDGIDESKKANVNNMVGWKLDDVIKYIDNNHLTNVTILFEYNDNVKKDVIISQDVVKELKRNEPITLISSLGKEGQLKNVTMKKLVGMDMFHALIFLGRNDLKYELVFTYQEDKEEGTILKQSVKEWQVVERQNYEPIVLTIAKQNEVTIIDLSKLTQTEITTWATNNRIKVEFKEQYDDTIQERSVISYHPVKGNTVPVNDTIYVTISKGCLYMPKFTTVDDFKNWANENDVSYNISYEYSDTVESGHIISSTHKEKQVVKNNDTIRLVVSQGGNTTVPNFINMSKEEATNSCNKKNLICKFIYVDNDKSYDTVVKQSIGKGTSVPMGTTITLTLKN